MIEGCSWYGEGKRPTNKRERYVVRRCNSLVSKHDPNEDIRERPEGRRHAPTCYFAQGPRYAWSEGSRPRSGVHLTVVAGYNVGCPYG